MTCGPFEIEERFLAARTSLGMTGLDREPGRYFSAVFAFPGFFVTAVSADTDAGSRAT